tara:strand:- start:2538 stop:3524 length:987 start_codon:yes stop_codon:yes gene_type:complete
MEYVIHILFSIITSYLFFKNFKIFAKKLGLIDNKNPNYNHKPTPTGSGIIFTIIISFGSLIFYISNTNFIDSLPRNYLIFLISIFLLSIISFKDDIKTIDPIFRLIFQIILVYLSLTMFAMNSIPIQSKISFIFFTFVWIYIINISNFIDGSDGFLAINFLFVAINTLLFKFITDTNIFSYYVVILIIPSVLIFFLFNKPPAKIYMGDAGSIALGYTTGFIFIEIVFTQNFGIAISIISYMLCDCTVSLIKKMRKGYMPWKGLYDYYFLIPVLKSKKNHKKVLYCIFIFHILNTTIILIQLYTGYELFFIFSFILSFITMGIFKNSIR